jgi:hypothetical protein
MNLVGLPLQTLLSTFAVAGGAVVVLYILKLRRRPVPVPFSRIWQRVLGDREATSLFSQLKRLLSLLVQLAMIAALVLALGDPRPAKNLLDGRSLVVLVDASASMRATDVSPTRIDEGKRRLVELVRGLGASDRMLVAQLDATVTPLSTMTGEPSELEAAVAAVQAGDTRADFARGLRFALDALRGEPHPEIVVVSDGVLGAPSDALGPVELGEVKLSYVGVGERGRNVAITGFSVRRYPLDRSRYEAMLELTNLAPEPLTVELSLFGDGEVTDVSRLVLGPNERVPRFYPSLSGGSRKLEARIQLADGTRDDLPADDVAYALMPERRRARVQVVTAGNMYLEAALLLDEYLDVTSVDPSKYPASGAFDVTIFDGVAPAVAEGSGHALYLDPSGSNLPFEVGKELLDDDPETRLGFDELESDHPIVRHTQLADVNVARAHVLRGREGDRVLGASFRGPLLLAGRRGGSKFVALGFDVRQSDLPLRVSWPLFLLNVINDFIEEDTSYLSSFTTGEVWRVPAPSALERATLVDPSKAERTVPVEEGRAVVLGRAAGFYELRSPEGEGYSAMFAANLSDAKESDIEPVRELKVGDVVAAAPAGFAIGVRHELWAYVLLGVALVSLVEWLSYHRRWTV